tara:strand:- start:166 stop:447 length:282 start_codon:yes stop_codon:yes gene_type:complete
MTVREIMERTGIMETGRAVAYIKDALEEMNLISETHTCVHRIDIDENKRFYDIPKEAVKILDIRCKDHNNEDGNYRSIPRSVYEPEIEDSDGI